MTAMLRPGTLKAFISSGRLSRRGSSARSPGNSTAICSTRCRRAEGCAGFAESLANRAAPKNPTRMTDRPTRFLISSAGIADMKVPFRLETLLERTAQIGERSDSPLQTEQGVIGQLELQPALLPG